MMNTGNMQRGVVGPSSSPPASTPLVHGANAIALVVVDVVYC